VAELMRVHRRQPNGPGPVVNHLVDARGRHRPVATNPKIWQVRQPMPFPGS
jgi:hypothetical protein